MEYFTKQIDKYGFTHSIDNLLIEYITIGGNVAMEKILKNVIALHDKYEVFDYYENLNLKPCSKFQFAQHRVHLDVGINLLFGTYINYAKPSESLLTVYPTVKLEINPNKHINKPIVKELVKMLIEYSGDVNLVKYDYAIDIPLKPCEVYNIGSRKEKGLYKGTRYFGQRNKNGYCKIYDKQLERGLDEPLTRVEHTISCSKGSTKSISFEPIYFKKKCFDQTEKKITPSDKVILELAQACIVNGIDVDDILDKLDKRKRKDIKEQLVNGSFEHLEFDQAILDKLLAKVFEYFAIKQLKIEAEEFQPVPEDEPLPFD